jgi:Cys-rich protein (TIGR01571 family)
MSLAYLSMFCSCCVFGWNMSRLGLGNMYVHIATFVLFCLAPFFIFDLAAISVDDEAVRDALGLAGVFLCVLGLLYGGFWRIQMRRRFGLPENRACCGKPDLTDCMQWLCCYSCTLAQEVRTADAYEVVQDTLQDKQPMPMHHRHHPTLQEELSTMQEEPLRFAGVFASLPLTPTAAAVRSVDPPSSVSATRTPSDSVHACFSTSSLTNYR